MDSNSQIWSVDRIECSSWREEGDRAEVFASNWSGDSCSFYLYRIPNEDVALVDFNLVTSSSDWWQTIHPKELESSLWEEAEKKLSDWNSEIDKILSWIPPGLWKKGPENDYAMEYAALAYLKETLTEFGGLKTNTVLARLLGIPVTTVVERVRECRNRGFLTTPGKGIRGKSQLTSKATKLLMEKGVIRA